MFKPLADKIRPRNLKDFYGQEQIIGENKLLRRAIESDNLPSMIFWGPPGSGKTTLAFIIAKTTKSNFKEMSAASCGIKDLKEITNEAEEMKRLGTKTILFLDEIHRWNKKQQDALLPSVERGLITLIGATTENPGFEVRKALLSRCQVFVLKKLEKDKISKIIKRALKDKENGLGNLKIKINKRTLDFISQMSNGDARKALNVIEYATSLVKNNIITLETAKESFQKSHILYDKNGEEHYNTISALHKSMRGSDANASIYWLVRMLEGGEDPLYIARRIVRFASEDIGIANSRALEQAVSAYQACHFIGMPEAGVILAQAVVYMAKCKKSNEIYSAYEKAMADVRKYGNLSIPLHLRNASNKLMKDLNYGKDYKYSPDFNYKENQSYLPKELKNRKYLKE